MSTRKIKYVAFEGGGLKGIAHFGVIDVLMKLGLWEEVDSLSGSSAGALMALMGATGWDFDTMYARFKALDLNSMITTDSRWTHIPLIGPIINLLTKPYYLIRNLYNSYGLHKADAVEAWIESVIKEVTDIDGCTFEQWHQIRISNIALLKSSLENPDSKNIQTKEQLRKIEALSKLKDIVVEAGNVSTKFNDTFSWKTEHKNVPISKAIRASMAFPLYISPVLIKGNFYVDGGVLRNCPGEVYEKQKGIPHKKLLCVMLEDKDVIEYLLQGKAPEAKPPRGFLSFLSKIFSMILGVQTNDMRSSAYLSATAFCDTLNLSTFDYKEVEGKEDALMQSGVLGAISHLVKIFPEIVSAHYSPAEIQQALQNTVQPLENLLNTFSSLQSQASSSSMPAPIVPGFNLSICPAKTSGTVETSSQSLKRKVNL